ncbi:MAG: hypothetical protein DMG38_19315 [Acidobacteria bacterium]|nr:MAG: hypothetical protein DMG38_19315 [Acidobacteriota bacterium]
MNDHGGMEHFADSSRFPECTPSFSSLSALVALFLFISGLGAQLVSAQSRRMELNDMAKIVSVSDPQISPDGKSIVIVVSRANLEQDRNERELVQFSGRYSSPDGC